MQKQMLAGNNSLQMHSSTRIPVSVPDFVLDKLKCPLSGEGLEAKEGGLGTESGSHLYSVDELGIPLFADHTCSEPGSTQQMHFDRVAALYSQNLGYPHTQEYNQYLDQALKQATEGVDFGESIEICCGLGEAFKLFGDKLGQPIGVDISQAMLHRCHKDSGLKSVGLIQGDATMLPLKDESFDTVFMLGGIHHVNDRDTLFSEIHRILKPGGVFIFREPVSDFLLWKMIRWVVYRVSPLLDADTERPLVWDETVPVLEKNGLTLSHWSTHGFLGFMFFMNSDILVFNRLFRFLPFIRPLTRFATRLDKWMLNLPFLKGKGLQVVGLARKPSN